MTTFAQWRSPASRLEGRRHEPMPRRYDSRVIDSFFAYCQAVSRTERHRSEAQRRTHGAAKRTLRVLMVCGSLLAYYLVERVAQAMTLF